MLLILLVLLLGRLLGRPTQERSQRIQTPDSSPTVHRRIDDHTTTLEAPRLSYGTFKLTMFRIYSTDPY